jgi:hypothetical protein
MIVRLFLPSMSIIVLGNYVFLNPFSDGEVFMEIFYYD